MPLTKGEPYDFIGNYTGWVAESSPAKATCAVRVHGDRLHYDVGIMGAVGPQSVKSVSPTGDHVEWDSYWEGDMLIFTPPDGYDIHHGFFWGYDKRIQEGYILHGATPKERLERDRFALQYRTSVIVA